jgi:hypothetical protein
MHIAPMGCGVGVVSSIVRPIQEGQRAERLPERPGTQQDDALAVSSC